MISRLHKHFVVFFCDLRAGIMHLYCDLTNSWEKLSRIWSNHENVKYKPRKKFPLYSMLIHFQSTV